jgi:hypothetical protein
MQLRWYSDGSIRWMRSLLINYLENDDLVLENDCFGSQKDDAINLAGAQIRLLVI